MRGTRCSRILQTHSARQMANEVAEIWIQHPFYPLYEVSNFGKVRELESGEGLAQTSYGKGYLNIRITDNGKRRGIPIHTMILEAFRGRRPEGMHASHLDGSKANNMIWNLVWEPMVDNILRHYGYRGRYLPDSTGLFDDSKSGLSGSIALA